MEEPGFDPLEAIERPRSVYLAFEAFPRPKGASSHIAAMLEALGRGHGPVLFLCCGYADMPALQIEGPIVIRRHKLHHPNLLYRAEDFGRFVVRILSRLKAPPELLAFRDPWGGVPALSVLPDTPTVFEVNGLPSWELGYNYPQVRNQPALLAKIEDLERFCLMSADRLVTVSEVTRSALVAIGVPPERIDLAPNSAGHEFFEADPEECDLDYLAMGRWFGYFGSLHGWQGVDLLIDAWAMTAGDFPDTNLVIVHNGRRAPLKLLKKRIRKKGLAQRVFLQSPLAPQRLARALTRLEFTTAPLTETFRNTVQGCCPIKIVESMAAGVPVLASRLRVNQALIRDGVDGLLARPGDRREWALAIRRLLEEPFWGKILAKEAKTQAQGRFTREIMFDRLEFTFSQAKKKTNPSNPIPAETLPRRARAGATHGRTR